VVIGVTISLAVSGATGKPVRAHQAAGCYDYPAARDPSNPLALAQAPGLNPLNGAQFFVDGPAKGAAAKAIEGLLGMDPLALPVSQSWGEFKSLNLPLLSGLTGDTASKVSELTKIADQPEAQRISYYSGISGGEQGASRSEIQGQVYKILCTNLAADLGTVPIINTYFLYPATGYHPSRRRILAAMPRFRDEVNGLVAGIGRHPAVLLLELDSIGSSGGWPAGALSAWEDAMRYEIDQTSKLAHAIVYTEGGYSDASGPRYTARVLNAIGVSKIRGFFTNDTHLNWAVNEVRWAEKVSKLAGGAHYVVNTAQAGNGPLNRHGPARVRLGNEVLCNPLGRALGPRPTTNPQAQYPMLKGDPNADAFLWTHVPGASSGPCNGGPPSGTFWTDRAISLAAAANDRVGPSPPWPSLPY
jgi:endoglucanase